MKQSPLTRAARAMFSLLAIVAWFHAANHCVVAGLLTAAPVLSAEHQPCPGHKAPEDDQQSEGCDASSCCKSLAAPVAVAKLAASYNFLSFTTEEFPGACAFDLGEHHDATIAEIDTGPPRSISFAESVLQRSVLAHAPPAFV